MPEPQIKTMRLSECPKEAYPHGAIHWLTSQAANGAQELSMAITAIPPGGRNPLHRHPDCEEVLYVLSGEVDHVVEGAPNSVVAAGEAILIPRNLKHQAINRGAVEARLLVVFSSPQRRTIIEPQ
ncbi:MAG: cupin domain-containing protein [Phycisphaeraceae bacterium]|nr:cupin domain-containing protein [Phycisphaeraceae bacterium]